ncbi:MAG: putative RNA uridine N3 methyltransferase, partial [Natronomonas sp.]
DDGMTVAFGAPTRGLPEILDCEPPETAGSEGTQRDDTRFDLWLNTVPNQGSEVVRTEEALFATLSPLTLE